MSSSRLCCPLTASMQTCTSTLKTHPSIQLAKSNYKKNTKRSRSYGRPVAHEHTHTYTTRNDESVSHWVLYLCSSRQESGRETPVANLVSSLNGTDDEKIFHDDPETPVQKSENDLLKSVVDQRIHVDSRCWNDPIHSVLNRINRQTSKHMQYVIDSVCCLILESWKRRWRRWRRATLVWWTHFRKQTATQTVGRVKWANVRWRTPSWGSEWVTSQLHYCWPSSRMITWPN